jgi:hypothetical protein
MSIDCGIIADRSAACTSQCSPTWSALSPAAEGEGALSGVDELEEQIATAGNHRQVTDLVDDEQPEATEERIFSRTKRAP